MMAAMPVMRAISNHCCRCIIQRMIAPLTAEWRRLHRARARNVPFEKKNGPAEGAIRLTSLTRRVGSHAVVMMVMVVMVMHFPSLCARDHGNGERHGGEGGQHESKLLHRDFSLGWIPLAHGR
jgi:hypothetical protein